MNWSVWRILAGFGENFKLLLSLRKVNSIRIKFMHLIQVLIQVREHIV